jgi:hypothetical protein
MALFKVSAFKTEVMNQHGVSEWTTSPVVITGEDLVTSQTPTIDIKPGTLLYQDYHLMIDPYQNASTLPKFSVTQKYIESRVSCSKTASFQNCSVTAQRKSLLPHPDERLTWLSFAGAFIELSGGLPGAVGDSMRHPGSQDITQKYIYNPDTAWVTSHRGSPLGFVAPEIFAHRLGQVINAYLIGSIAPLL